MKKAALLVTIFTLIVKGSGFIRDIILSYFYGASHISDAYLISLTIPTFIFSFISMGITTGYIPIFSKIAQKSEIRAMNFTSNVSNVSMIFSTILVIVGVLFTEPIVNVFAAGFKGETLNLAVEFTRVSFITLYFYILTAIYSGYLQLKNDFSTSILVGLPMNIITMAAIVISTKTNLMILTYGSVIAAFSQLFVWIPAIIRKKFKYKLILNFNDKNLKTMIIIAIPAIIGLNINQINVLIDRTLASTITAGAMSSLDYANRLNIFINGIIANSLATAMYPAMTKMHLENNKSGLNASVREAFNIISIIVLPISLGIIIFSKQIVVILFGRGAFDHNAIFMTSQALLYFTVGMWAYGVREILSRAFYAITDTKTPLKNSVIAVIINVTLDFILMRYMGIGGLALSTSVAAIVTVILLSMDYNKKISKFEYKAIIETFMKCLVASVVMGLCCLFVFNIFVKNSGNVISLMVSIIVGMVLYLFLIYFMKVKELNKIILLTRRKFIMKRSA